ncbi:MAG: type II secretion system protein GspM, partial [Steroidobacteraceae bacterium]
MNVRDWFDNLNERERNLVYVAGALLGVALVYLVLVLPFQASGKKMTARVAQKTADLAWMQASAPQAMA